MISEPDPTTAFTPPATVPAATMASASSTVMGAKSSSRVRIVRHGLRPLPRSRPDPPHRPRLRRAGGRAGGRGARPREAVPLRDRRQARRAGDDGHPVPRGVRRRRGRLARLRDRGRGADARRLLGGDHAVRAHVARHAADLPVRHRRAEARLDAGADVGPQAGRVRADRAGGGVGRRQRPHAGAARGRRVGDQRRQAVHHQRGDRHLRDGRASPPAPARTRSPT